MTTEKIERADSGPDTYVCNNCENVWPFARLNNIADIWERIEAGGTVPAGECPVCGALCYPTVPAQPDFPQLHDDAPPVPAGLQPRAGVEYGCGSEACDKCYEPVAVRLRRKR